jgi:hypothetical protein
MTLLRIGLFVSLWLFPSFSCPCYRSYLLLICLSMLQILFSVSHLPVNVADPIFCFSFACPCYRYYLLLLICLFMLQILSSACPCCRSCLLFSSACPCCRSCLLFLICLSMLQILYTVSHLPVHVEDPFFCFLFACPCCRSCLLLLICLSMLQFLSSASHLPVQLADLVFCFSFAF